MSKPPRRRGRISPEDRAIWDRVVSSATPLDKGAKKPSASAPALSTAAPDGPDPGEPAPQPPRSRPDRVVRPEGRGAAPAVRWSLAEQRPAPVGRPEPGLDRRTAERLRRGDRAPDARIDLHGLTAERAHSRLDRFVAEALRANHRCLLVITGKGGRNRSGDDAPFMTPDVGVLRHAAPRWLRTGPHATRIVGIYEAHQRHGGGGAFYVYLKRGR